jgi:HEPN domain-containing protein
MKDETRTWVSYADENLDVAELTLGHGHLNACLQNVQQAVEKYLKAVIVERGMQFRRTHSIRELVAILAAENIRISIDDDEMDLMDAIYVPSKYPIYSALPHMIPDTTICHNALNIAHRVREIIVGILKVEGTG